MNFNWKKGFSFGLLIWVIMFAAASVFVAYDLLSDSPVFNIILIVLTAVLVFLAARYVAPQNPSQALQYGLLWAVTGVVLDYLVSSQFAPDIFSSVY